MCNRASALIIAALLIVPAAADAQRIPMRSRPRTAELPPMPGSVAREMSYKRLPYSLETYPMMSFFTTSGTPAGRDGSWTAGGTGTRLDLRVAPATSITLDLAASFLGAPTSTQTAELGTRFRPDRPVTSERRYFPFIDVRAGYVSSMQSAIGTVVVDPWTGGTPVGPGSRYSQGFGGSVGAGLEFALTRMVSVTTAAGMMRSSMRTRSLDASQPSIHYTMTERRVVAGLRFNPVRAIEMPGGMFHEAAARP
jgi:hypothetical protein